MDNQELSLRIDQEVSILITKLSQFSQEQINSIPFPGSWTAAQLGQHLLESFGVSALSGNVKPTERQPGEKVPIIKSIFLDFDAKLEAPEFIIPSNEPIKKEKLLNDLAEAKTRLLTFIANHDLSPTCVDFVLPELGEFTRLEWLSLLLFHTQRHLRQLDNIARHIFKSKQ